MKRMLQVLCLSHFCTETTLLQQLNAYAQTENTAIWKKILPSSIVRQRNVLQIVAVNRSHYSSFRILVQHIRHIVN